jgi:hemerythrin-like domain-containing protein
MSTLSHGTSGGERAEDAIELLEKDHREIERLLYRLEPGGAMGPREVFERLTEVLSVHSSVEKEVFYPAVRRALAGGSDVVKDSLFDHKDVELSLERLRKVPMEAGEFTVELLALAGRIRDHVRKEEAEIFPALRRTLDEDTLVTLGERLVQASRHAPTRPHPHAPSSALGARVAGMFARPMDRARQVLARRP